MIRNFDDLTNAIVDFMGRTPQGMPNLELAAWCQSQPEFLTLQELAKVYLRAKAHPPEGVIGVGAITYAERCLIDAQGGM